MELTFPAIFTALEAISTTSGRNKKLEMLIEIFNEYPDEIELLYHVGLAPDCPTYIGKLPKPSEGSRASVTDTYHFLKGLLVSLLEAKGPMRKDTLQALADNIYHGFDEVSQKWIIKCITKDWTLGTGISAYNKAIKLSDHCDYYPEIFEFDTVRVSEMEAADINPEDSYLSIKADGVNSTLDYVNISRNGNLIALKHIEDAVSDEIKQKYILFGELVSSDRQSSSGLCNSAIKKGYETDQPVHKLVLHVFDALPREEYMSRQFVTPFHERKDLAARVVSEINHPNIQLIEHKKIQSVDEVYTFFDEVVQQGEEGIIWNDKDMLFELDRSKKRARIKEVLTADLEIVEILPHSKKPNMAGSIVVRTSCGRLTSAVGTGLSDMQRKSFWVDRLNVPGKIIKTSYNKVIPHANKEGMFSLFIPVFKPGELIRIDKTVADSLDEIEKGGKKK